MKNFIILFLMLILPSLAMAQGQITRKPVTPTPTHKHSVYGPKGCKECNRLRRHTHSVSGPEWCAECNRQKQEEQRIAEQQRLEEQRRREEEQRLAEERKRKEEQCLAEERKRKEEEELRFARLDPTIRNLVNNMVYVSGGTFTMGDASVLGSDEGKPAHRVTLSSYYIGKYEVTQAEWKAVMGSIPSDFKGDNLPVENVSWNDCSEFIRKLNSLTGKNFRLPTEAEWEFAARGGNNSRGYEYSGSNDIDSVAWHSRNSGLTLHPVGQKSPNELGLYDMSGNVWEWCQDWYGDYSSSSQTNPNGSSSGFYRVIRGGCCFNLAGGYSVSNRNGASPDGSDVRLGLRLAM